RKRTILFECHRSQGRRLLESKFRCIDRGSPGECRKSLSCEPGQPHHYSKQLLFIRRDGLCCRYKCCHERAQVEWESYSQPIDSYYGRRHQHDGPHLTQLDGIVLAL